MTDLRVKVNGLLRVKAFSRLGGHKQGNTGSASTSGNGTSRSSSRGRGGCRSCRGVVEAAAEARLSPFQAPYSRLHSTLQLRRLESDNLVASQGCGGQSQEVTIQELKSLLGHRKVLSHSMLLLVRCVKVIWLIR